MDELGRLASRFREGDARAFDALFARTERTLFGYALGYLGSAALAEEVCQDAYLAFIEDIEGFEPRGSTMAYLLNAVRFRALDRLKRLRVERDAAPRARDVILVRAEQSAPGAPDARLTGERVNAAMYALPVEQRVVVLLKVHAGLTFEEIALAEQIPLATAQSRYRYGIRKLRVALGGDDARMVR